MNKKEKAKYYTKRIVGYILAPLLVMFQLGRAFERIHMLMSGRWERVYR